MADPDLDDANDLYSFSTSHSELKWYKNPQQWIRIIIVLVLASFIIFALCHPTFSADLLTFFLRWIELHPWDGAMAFILAYIICNVLMIPGIILSVGAGIVYVQVAGFWPGVLFATAILCVSAFLGSCLAFLNARFLLRTAVVYLIRNQPKFRLIDKAVQHNGVKVVFLFRLSPVTPYSLFNYVMGVSSVTFTDYCIGGLGMIPNIFAYAYLGATIQNIVEISTVNPENSKFLLCMTVVGAVILVITVGFIFYITRKELLRINKDLDKQHIDMENTPLNGVANNAFAVEDEYDSNEDEIPV
mmetsp:Transcript_10570/g.15885  ORF Transcript_10570/g.15885 Transcript_10570/m.15885 type:complete len:301 (-) Transcript_10570:88-990(-)